MKVQTDSERVRLSRKLVLELLASSVDLSTTPVAAGYLERYGAHPERFGPPAPPDPDRDRKRTGHHVEPDGQTAATVHAPVKVDNELYVRDYSKCILCYKCVDACGEQYQNTFAIDVAGRGFDARISTEYVAELPDSACVYCGNCIAVCPTGALMFRSEHELRAAGRLARGRADGDADRSAPTAASAAPSSCTCRTTDRQGHDPGRPRRHPRQPLHQGPLRLPARAKPRLGGRRSAVGRRGPAGPLHGGTAPLLLQPPRARCPRRRRRHSPPRHPQPFAELRHEPLDRELAVACLAALVLADRSHHRCRADRPLGASVSR